MIHQTAIIYPGVTIEEDVVIGPYSVIGAPPEHREFYNGEESKGVWIKKGTRISSHVTIDSGTIHKTVIDKGSAIFQKSHVGHDCIVGPYSTIGGQVSLAGHTHVMAGANVSGHSCTFQRVVIGAYSFIGGHSFVTRDIPPGERWISGKFVGYNDVGLSRAEINYDECMQIYKEEYERLIAKKN